MKKHLYDFFIPHEGNNHLPRSLHPRFLIRYSFLILVFKAFVVLSLLFVFPTIAEFSTITQNRIVELVNIERRARGLNELRINPLLEAAAKMKLQDMIDKNYFDHNAPDGTPPWVWFKKAGYIYTYAGENLAINFVEAEEVHKAWMESKSHRENILNPNYKEIGVAVGVGNIDGSPATLVVQFFGTTFAPPQFANVIETEKVVEKKVVKSSETQSAIERKGGTEPAAQPAKKPEQQQEPSSIQKSSPIPEKDEEFPVKLPYIEQTDETKTVAYNKSEEADIIVPSQKSENIPARSDIEEQNPENIYTMEQERKILTGRAQTVTLEKTGPLGFVGRFIRWMQKFYIFIIGFLFLSLLIKILIRAHIQHQHIVAIVLLIIIGSLILLFVRLHFLEGMGGVRIL